MNISQTNFYDWLLSTGYRPGEVSFEKGRVPVFLGRGKGWMVKKLYRARVILHVREEKDYLCDGGGDSFLVLMPENPGIEREPLYVIPCPEVSFERGMTFEEYDEYRVGAYPRVGRHARLVFQYLGKGGTMSIHLADEGLLEWLDGKVESGVYQSRSQAVELGLRKLRFQKPSF